MNFIESMNQRVKRFNFFDLEMAQCSAMFLALIIVKLVPHIMDVNIGWFIALFVVCAIKPF